MTARPDPVTGGLAAYFQLMQANGIAHLYRQAVESGILTALSDRERTADEVAGLCDLDPPATALVLDALVPLGLVTRVADAHGSRYGLTILAAALLVGPYRELGDPYWTHLPALLQTGHSFVSMDAPAESEGHYRNQARALAWMLGPAAERAADVLSEDGRVPRWILDVGAGSAIWGLTLAARSPAAIVTALDWPSVLEIARSTADATGLADRLRLLPGSYHEVDIPESNFDLAFVANVTHLETPEGCRTLFRRLHPALVPGGRLVVVDVFDGDPRGEIARGLYALGLALRTDHGRLHAPGDLIRLLDEAGFHEARVVSLDAVPHTVGLIEATKA